VKKIEKKLESGLSSTSVEAGCRGGGASRVKRRVAFASSSYYKLEAAAYYFH
jgi:hypothetical protein